MRDFSLSDLPVSTLHLWGGKTLSWEKKKVCHMYCCRTFEIDHNHWLIFCHINKRCTWEMLKPEMRVQPHYITQVHWLRKLIMLLIFFAGLSDFPPFSVMWCKVHDQERDITQLTANPGTELTPVGYSSFMIWHINSHVEHTLSHAHARCHVWGLSCWPGHL